MVFRIAGLIGRYLVVWDLYREWRLLSTYGKFVPTRQTGGMARSSRDYALPHREFRRHTTHA
jgi:hypothetical protein